MRKIWRNVARVAGGFGCEEMDVLGHEDVTGYAKVLLLAGLFEEFEDGVFCFGGVEEGLTFVTTEGDEGGVLDLVVAS